MIIYGLTIENVEGEIYIGKTSNLIKRLYSHKSKARKEPNIPVYTWINKYGWENVKPIILCECSKEEADEKEKYFIKLYENKGYKVANTQLTKNFEGFENLGNKFQKREEVWLDYTQTDMSRQEIAEKYKISCSLISKIIQEHGGTTRKDKLYGLYEEIQQKIISGVSIRKLAREYGVQKTAITNINKGITAYNPNLSYPLNEKVRDKNLRDSWFKSKV